MTKEDLIVNSIVELSNINIHANSREKSNLLTNLTIINGGNSERCVYGLLVGSCFNERAVELITKCSEPIYFDSISNIQHLIVYDLNVKKGINYFNRDGYTSLEVLLRQYRDKAIELIKQYIKIYE